MQSFKAVVRRRNSDDDWPADSPEDWWPSELRWVADWDRFDEEGRFVSGCAIAFETHAEGLAEACAEADKVRRANRTGGSER